MKTKVLLRCILLGFSLSQEVNAQFQVFEKIIQSEQKTQANKRIQASTQTGLNYDLKHLRLEWNLNPALFYISGKVRSTFLITNLSDSLIRFDLSQNLKVDSVFYKGFKINSFLHSNQQVSIRLPTVLQIGNLDSLSIFYSGKPVSTGFGSFYTALHANVPILWTLSEPYGSKDWWPSKNSLVDKIDSIDIFIKTKPQYFGVSNGLLVAERLQDTTKIYHWKHKYPISTYLIAVAVTNYTSYYDPVPLVTGDSVKVWNYIYPEQLQAIKPQTKAIVKVLRFFDSLFVPYPFKKEKYGHAQFNWGGGMEHQTVSFMGSFDFDLQAHELAHHWFGDYITCRSFQDIWLNEGFATYANMLANEKLNPSIWETWKPYAINLITSENGGSVNVDDTLDVGRIFSGRLSYNKGAFLLHMLRWQLGDSLFFKGIKNYLNDASLRYHFAQTIDFQKHMEIVSGQNLDGFFADWFAGQGFPTVIYAVQFDEFGKVSINLNQFTSHSSVGFFEMKVPFYFSNLQKDSTLVLNFTAQNQTFEANLGFLPTQTQVDPKKWLLAKFLGTTIVGQKNIIDSDFQTIGAMYQNSELIITHSKQEKMTVFAPQGKLILEADLKSGCSRFELPNLPSGVYFIKTESGKTGRFVKTD